MQWYLSVLKNYVGFSGRARRKEYWMFTLINAIVGAIINVIQLILGLELPYLSMLYLLATFLPVLALAIRRLHDTDRSGARPCSFCSVYWLARASGFLHRRYFWQQSLRKRSEVWFKLILELGRYFAPFINNNKYYFPLKVWEFPADTVIRFPYRHDAAIIISIRWSIPG